MGRAGGAGSVRALSAPTCKALTRSLSSAMFPRRSSAENREETCSLGRPAAACVQSYRYVPGVRCCAWFRVRVGVMVRV